MTTTVAGAVAVMVGFVSASVPSQAAAPSNASNTAALSVTLATPLIIFGFRIPVPDAGTIRSSGFRYHSDAGMAVCLPSITRSVMLFGAKLRVPVHAVEALATMAPGFAEPTVYAE